MTYENVKKILNESSQFDWIIDDETGSFTYRHSLHLRIEREIHCRPFNEPWATSHPDSEAVAINYTVKYGQSFIERKMLVAVDGYRAILPLPENANSPYVSAEDVNFAEIVDISGRVNEYLKRSNLQIR